MFRKLVSNLPFSPALVGQLAFYARRLKKEELTRRLGLIFTILAIAVQSFAVFSPPESANAANPADMIYGGVSSVQDILRAYDQPSADYKEAMTYAGVTRAEIAAMQSGSVNSIQFGKGESSVKTWGRVHRFSEAQGEVKHVIPLDGGGSSVLYSKPLWLYDSTDWTLEHGSTYPAFIGHSAKIGWFAVMKSCGNLLTQVTPKPAPAGAFIAATCDVINGYAYDNRSPGSKINVYLYFGGPPGTGERVGPILADDAAPNSPIGGGHGFTYNVPLKYQIKDSPTQVWGVLIPLDGWESQSVQFANTVTIPGGCQDTGPAPLLKCDSLTLHKIERTKYSLTAKSIALHGAKVIDYRFTVSDSKGNPVFNKIIATSATTAKTGPILLPAASAYHAKVVVRGSTGSDTGPNCELDFKVPPPGVCVYNPGIPENSPDCQPCPGNPDLWIKDKKCKAVVVESKTVKNVTRGGGNATEVTAEPGDRLEYTLTIENIGYKKTTFKVSENISDVLEYADLTDPGGGSFNQETKTIRWDDATLEPNQKESFKFLVQVFDSIPSMPRGSSEPTSYDCIMTNSFGNTTSVPVKCPPPKDIEEVIGQLPSTGPGTNMFFGGLVLVVVTYFYARTRQVGKEIRLIRHDFNAGSL